MLRDGLLVEAPLRTDQPNLFAAGDVCAEQTHVAGAIATGSNTAMVVAQRLLADEFGWPYPPD